MLPLPVPAPHVIPLLGSYNTPLAHCNLKQVKRLLLGLNLSQFADTDGSLDLFWEAVEQDFIPEASQKVARFCRTNFDYTKEIWTYDGPGSYDIVLPRRFINYVNAVFLRYLPSQIWYRFVRMRLVDGSEFAAIGGVEPPPPPPEPIPPYPSSFQEGSMPVVADFFTGIEDADLFVDPRRRLLTIPPRVLFANVGIPQAQFSFFQGVMNVEVHFAYGFAPVAYTDGTPLVFDPVSGAVAMSSPYRDVPTGGQCGGNPIDWSSGMPKAITLATARIVYADILRRLWRGISGGLSSMSVDGASESYGGSPFGGDADAEEQRALNTLKTFSVTFI